MGKQIPPRKKHPKKDPIASVRAKGKKNKLSAVPVKPPRGWMLAGFDTSMSALAGAAIAYDGITKKLKGPVFVMRRWTKEDHYFDRLKMAALAHELISDLQAEMVITMGPEEIHIAQEEPFPFSMVGGKSFSASFVKQQSEISGAFLGGLLRYGYTNIWQMSHISWRQTIASDLGITIHHSKWKDPSLCAVYNCNPAETGKFRAKQWAFDCSQDSSFNVFHRAGFEKEIPDWPDIIKTSKLGNTPRPEGSKAKAFQPDDRYDALAICWTLYLDLLESGVIK